CDRNWNPSDIDEVDYLDGFNGEDIKSVEFSSGQIIPYTHYTLRLPNEDVQWRLSGNYLLIIYDEEGEPFPVITKRFMVSEQAIGIATEMVRPRQVDQINTHHALQMELDISNFRIDRPLNELEVMILQNKSWLNSILNIKPKFVSGNRVKFNLLGELSFPALKEFRQFDTRSIDYRLEGVEAIDKRRYGTDVWLELDHKRTFDNYHTISDFNGGFHILANDVSDSRLQAEYVNVIFTLKCAFPYEGQQVFIYGKLSDWELIDEFKMNYDDYQGYYRGEVLLKQGVYDYMYALEKDGKLDLQELEGNWKETENNYTILVYYSPFGSRYDRLISSRTINSN
ncbi:MAG: DUF5103 domain-containing protein, partial [Bacteroidia bacterium]|nr:DUF5103 domain-containing protein [Bacteroidia bacterium]